MLFRSTEVDKGYVIKTEPEAGQQAHKGSTIIVYVSLGVEAGQVSVDEWVGMTIDDATMLAEYKNLKVEVVKVASYEDEGIVVKQSIEKGEKVEIGTTITFEVSDGTTPDGTVPFTIDFPSDANGRFVVSFLLQNEDGTIDTQDTPVFFVPEYTSITQDVVGSGENVSVTIILSNLNTNLRANIGTYKFNFADNYTECTSGGDIRAAFEQVEGFPTSQTTSPDESQTEPTTEAPTEPTTEAPTQPPHNIGVNGEYDANGNWVDYVEYTNGQWVNGVWTWYQPGVNGYWADNYTWIWQDFTSTGGQW